MTKQTKNGRTIKVTFFVHELQDFIENTHTHTHTTGGQLPISKEPKTLI